MKNGLSRRIRSNLFNDTIDSSVLSTPKEKNVDKYGTLTNGNRGLPSLRGLGSRVGRTASRTLLGQWDILNPVRC